MKAKHVLRARRKNYLRLRRHVIEALRADLRKREWLAVAYTKEESSK